MFNYIVDTVDIVENTVIYYNPSSFRANFDHRSYTITVCCDDTSEAENFDARVKYLKNDVN